MQKTFAKYQTPVLLSVLIVAVTAVTVLAGSSPSAVTEMLIRMIAVVGLYIFVGNSGIVSFGHIGFMCIGAYAAGWCTAQPMFKQMMLSGLPVFLQENQYPFPLALGLAIVLPMMVAWLLGVAIMRLSGMAAAIASFAFLMIVYSVYSNWDSVTAGVSTIVGIPKVVGPWTAFGFSVLAIFIAWLFQNSRYGLLLKACRDDAVAAQASAVHLRRMRLIAFVLSAGVTGLAGGLYAQFLGLLAVESFYLTLTFTVIAMLVVGGMSSLTGAVIGVLAVTSVIELLRALEGGVQVSTVTLALPLGSQEIGLGILLACALIFRPSGLTGGHELRILR
ncbi:branched-chain amino acid ABC transporter permease [Paracoccus versutus]|uniref:Amino acid/amide ABC transporter membrane protein 2 (HAAT family) n=1 Tax=Paracoccus versutus TaxID=34007 RepID=A0A3D9XSV2_PARVE|nr:branched-chain amino acid ABC transporter permease [Paracoccus versutus]REF73426.1 amino acid/amide ABC transporter membrane protein 2 (HAAT family) [Paracoccus versutus]WGR54557.1 branched-chain amino acid ABC transporter permease [Paracoccus versutus]